MTDDNFCSKLFSERGREGPELLEPNAVEEYFVQIDLVRMLLWSTPSALPVNLSKWKVLRGGAGDETSLHGPSK